jgi:hypothetical protein
MQTIAELAKSLSQISGETITVEMIESDIKAGAPTGPDGSINPVFYLAWLLKHEDDAA